MTGTDAPARPTVPAFVGNGRKKLLIQGSWDDAAEGKALSTSNPATGEVLSELAAGTAVDVDRAVAAARTALDGPWSTWKPFDRQRAIIRLAELVEQNYDELTLLDTLEMGIPWSRWRVSRRALAQLHWYAGQAVAIHGKTIPNSALGNFLSWTLKEPVGVVGAIIPWNGPISAAISKVGPVLATGCTVVLKPAEEASLSTLRLGALCLEAGIPEGVVNVVTGTGESAGAALAAHPGVDKIAFTGSFETGQRIVQASAGNMKRLTLELGGKSPNIIFADADLPAAIAGAATAIFINSGQVCTAGSRLFVEKSAYDQVVEGVAKIGAAMRVGDGLDPSTEMGPLVSQSQLDRVLGYMSLGQAEGAKPVTGGGRVTKDGLDRGFFVEPTVLTSVENGMRIAQEEIFGPVVSVIPFTEVDEVVRMANETQYGLASGVWTKDIGRAHTIAGKVHAGTVWLNTYLMMDPAVPFGGYKHSGYGRESGVEHIAEYLNTKTVWLKTD
jgi:aldehyde dehydrogenase (NAD+)